MHCRDKLFSGSVGSGDNYTVVGVVRVYYLTLFNPSCIKILTYNCHCGSFAVLARILEAQTL